MHKVMMIANNTTTVRTVTIMATPAASHNFIASIIANVVNILVVVVEPVYEEVDEGDNERSVLG